MQGVIQESFRSRESLSRSAAEFRGWVSDKRMPGNALVCPLVSRTFTGTILYSDCDHSLVVESFFTANVLGDRRENSGNQVRGGSICAGWIAVDSSIETMRKA